MAASFSQGEVLNRVGGDPANTVGKKSGDKVGFGLRQVL